MAYGIKKTKNACMIVGQSGKKETIVSHMFITFIYVLLRPSFLSYYCLG